MYRDLQSALWRVSTLDEDAWLCELGGALCKLKHEVILESDPPDPSPKAD